MVSDNLANSSTYGYKTTYASFEELVTGTSSAGYSSGGVIASSRSNVSAQGLLQSNSKATNLAISGSGFFVVSPSSNSKETYYTRDGEFTTDSNGYLVNNGYNLMGWRTDASGNVVGNTSTSTLTAIDTNIVASTAAATTSTSIQANLPADATTGETFTSDMSVYDSLGTAHSIAITWTKTDTNTWTASFANPTLSSDSSKTSGTVTSSDMTITFNSDGTLASTSPNPPTLTISGWTTSAANSSISLDLGTVGKADGLTQYSTGTSSPTVMSPASRATAWPTAR